MTPWQRRLRLGLGLFVLVFAVGLFFSLRKPAAPPAPPVSAKADPESVAEFHRGVWTQAKGTRQELQLAYDRLVTYPDGRSRLQGVRAVVPDRGGRRFEIAAREADVAAGESDVSLRGAVELVSGDGLRVAAEEAVYHDKDGTVAAPGEVSFSKGRMSGRSRGMRFDRETDSIALLADARIAIAPDAAESGASTIEAGAATIARRDKQLRFEQGVTILRGERTIEADAAVAQLTEDEQRVETLQLRGNSRVSGAAAQPGGLRAMAARDIDLGYAEDGQTLRQALLLGSGVIDLAGEGGEAGRRLAGETIDIGLADDGTTLTKIDARGQVRLDLPADARTPGRVIRAGLLRGRGEPPAGLTAADFSEQVEFHETPRPGAPPRTARAARMELTLAGGFGAIESARFSGGFRFEDGSVSAVSREAQYEIARGVLHLHNGPDPGARLPQVVDERATIEGRRIDVVLESRGITATGAVKSAIRPDSETDRRAAPKPAADAAGKAGGAGGRMPSILKKDVPVSATADALQYDGQASRLVYTGGAQLWQGETTIKADTIDLDDQRGDLAASGQVVTRMMLHQEDRKTGKKEKRASVASARNLVYEEAARRATYTGGAHLDGVQGDLRAERIEVFLAEDGEQVERLEAYPAQARTVSGTPAAGVSIRTPEGRTATGNRLTYHGADERYVMSGTPVTIVEECRETTGRTLTFFKSADRIVVDGNEQKRTEVKGGAPCSGPRLD